MSDIALPLLAVGILTILLLPRLRTNLFWRATVTPLASIIGSGFLIAAPLLGGVTGSFTPWAMLIIVGFSYLVGAVIRFNIRYLEPLLVTGGGASRRQRLTERVSGLLLFAAYVVSVAFYIRLMSGFLLKGIGADSVLNARLATTATLLAIGAIGWRRGLGSLEKLEEYSVSVKLAIIGALFAGLLVYDSSAGFGFDGAAGGAYTPVEIARIMAGLLLITQGFETSRYLGGEYSAATRIASMRLAQLLSAAIYVGFAILIVPLLSFLPAGRPSETAIIELSRHAAAVLPLMLIVAAAMSQFSAAVADTLGGGGLVCEHTDARILPASGYLLVTGGAIALVWSADVLEIVVYASRAFALYYFAQTILALEYAAGHCKGWRGGLRVAGLAVMAIGLALVVLFAIPAG